MEISIILVYKNLDGYIADVESKVDSVEILWNKYTIGPYGYREYTGTVNYNTWVEDAVEITERYIE